MKDLTIREIDDSKPQFATHPDTLDLLRAHHRPPLLPNLRRLVFCLWDSPHHVYMFIQPSLRFVDFQPDFADATDLFLSLVMDDAPKLEELRITPEGDLLEEVREQLSDTICALKHLTHLEFAWLPLRRDALLHLSSLPKLQVFCFELSEDNAGARLVSSFGRFLHLVDFEFLTTIADATIPASLLRSINSASLTHLTIVYRAVAPISSLGCLFTAISKHEYLTHCVLDFWHTADIAWCNGRLQDDILSPLFRLPLMTVFRLCALPIDISAARLGDLVAGWPRLRNLRLETTSWRHRGPTLDILDLPILAGCCPELRHLAAALRPLHGNWTWGLNTPFYSACMLAEFDLQYMPIARAAAHDVVTFVAHVFPRARMCNKFALSYGFVQNFSRGNPEVADVLQVMDGICTAKNDLLMPHGRAGQ